MQVQFKKAVNPQPPSELATKLARNLIVQCESGWNSASEKQTELYLLQEVREGCNCQLLCPDCKVCIHKYICSCIDTSIKYNMCKHIHLLCTHLNKKENMNSTAEA